MVLDSFIAYFGTYTASGKSKGIYTCRLNTSTGHLSEPELAAETRNPSFLAIHPDGRHLYAVGENMESGSGKTSAVSAFAIDRPTGKLALLNSQSTGGLGPCHLAVDRTGKCLLVANYWSGSCAALPVIDNGALGARKSFMQHAGNSINPDRQKGPHAHSINLAPDNRFAFVADLGLDKIMIYKFDADRATLQPNDPPFVQAPPGSGPRHMAFHPNGRFAYVINEMSETVIVFEYAAQSGVLKEVQIVSALPLGREVQPGDTAAEVQVDARGRFLYASNRGHDSIAVFAIDRNDGTLHLVQHASTNGRWPRHFAAAPGGAWLLAANQDSGNVVVFAVDPETGRLTPTGQTVEIGAPVCVKFLTAVLD